LGIFLSKIFVIFPVVIFEVYEDFFIGRIILSKVLTAPSESSRLYATQFLLVLLRARLPDFQKWGIELLVMQLYDQSKAVSLAAIAILGEATEEKVSVRILTSNTVHCLRCS